MVIDAIRCAKLALDRGGPLDAASACMMKHPRKQMRDSEAFVALERFIEGEIEDQFPEHVGIGPTRIQESIEDGIDALSAQATPGG